MTVKPSNYKSIAENLRVLKLTNWANSEIREGGLLPFDIERDKLREILKHKIQLQYDFLSDSETNRLTEILFIRVRKEQARLRTKEDPTFGSEPRAQLTIDDILLEGRKEEPAFELGNVALVKEEWLGA